MGSWEITRPRFTTTARLPRAIAVACDSKLEWSLFRMLDGVELTQVVSCSTIPQLIDLCESGAIEAAVIDLDAFGLNPAELPAIRARMGSDAQVVAVAAVPIAGVPLDRRLHWLLRPVSAEQIVSTLRWKERPPPAFGGGML
jgi:hypothetical protein